jgi:hypothetical protein
MMLTELLMVQNLQIGTVAYQQCQNRVVAVVTVTQKLASHHQAQQVTACHSTCQGCGKLSNSINLLICIPELCANA